MREFNLRVDTALVMTSSMGNLLKWIIVENGKTIYVKSSTYTNVNFKHEWMYESYSEVIVSRLAKELGIENVVQYYLCKIHLDNGITTIGCYSYSFLKEDEKYISIGYLDKTGILENYTLRGYDGYVECVRDIHNKFHIDYEIELKKIITLDYITLNEDRHLNNFGFIYRLKDRRLRIAPIFDNGNSLFALKHIEEFKYSKNLERHLICKPFCNKHSAQLRMIGTKPKINSNIENALKYIKNLERQGLNKQRVNFIQDMLSSRVQELI